MSGSITSSLGLLVGLTDFLGVGEAVFVAIAEGFTLGLAVGEGVFEATRGVSSGVAAGVDSSIVGVTVGEDAGVEVGDDAGVSIESDSLWFGVQRESNNPDKTASARMTTEVFL